MRFVVAVLILATGCAKPTAKAPAASDAVPAADLASEITAVGLAADATPQE